MQTLEQLKAAQLDLEQKLAQNKEKQIAIFDAEFCKKNGFYVGDTVLFEGKKAQIAGFQRGYDSQPYRYEVSLFNKDGAPSVLRRVVYTSAKMEKA